MRRPEQTFQLRARTAVGAARGAAKRAASPAAKLLRAGLLLAVGLALTVASTADQAPEAPAVEPAVDAADPRPGTPRVIVIRVASAIHPVASEFIAASIAQADEQRAAALVLELDTPGGLLTSTGEITRAILGAETPVVVYVSPSGARAASAGFFILMSADVAAMAPGTNTGAAHPVSGQGEDIEGDMGEKVEQDAAANIRSLAQQRGRNVELAEAAVVESRSFAADEALENQLIEFVAADVRQLLEQMDGHQIERPGGVEMTLDTANAEIVELEMPVLQRILAKLVDPGLAFILLSLGVLGIYMEVSNPGTLIPGALGAVCLILAFYALSILPLNFAGVALILLGLGLFVAELQVPSFGLLTAGGAVALILGSLMLFKDVDPSVPEFQVDMRLVVGTALGLVLVMVLLTSRTLQIKRGRVTTGLEGLVTERGVARTALDPRGKVFVHGELWAATSEQPVEEGAEVEVVAVDGMLLHVRPSPPQAPPPLAS